jgi:UDP-N-acetylmuramyl tripeptide synthase
LPPAGNAFIVKSRIAFGHTQTSTPPAAWFQLDRERLGAALDRCSDLEARLQACGLTPAPPSREQPPAALFADLLGRLIDALGHRCGTAHIEDRPERCTVLLPVDDGRTARRAGELLAEILTGESAPSLAASDHPVQTALAALRQQAAGRALNPDARLMLQAAQAAGLPTLWLDQEPFRPFDPGPGTPPQRVGLLQIGQGERRRLFAGSLPAGQNDGLLESLRCRAELMPRLARAGLPVPPHDGELSSRNSATRAVRTAEGIGYPVAVKTLYKARFPHLDRRGDVLGPLTNEDAVRRAFEQLAGADRRVWVEGWTRGDDYRFLIIGGQVRSVRGPEGLLDAPDAIGGKLVKLAERAASVCQLGLLAGVDLRIVDPLGPDDETNCLVTNVLPDPDLIGHAGEPADATLAQALIDCAIRDPDRLRIPIVAVTGTNGKTTTCRMLQRILQTRYERVGLATTGGAFIGPEQVHDGDVAGATGAAWLLADDRCQAAVLETSRGGLLKLGTAFDRCDVATCLNVRADHLGYDGIDSLEAMAEVKGRLIERAHGAAVLNADDPRCLAMRSRAPCDRIVLVAESGDQPDLLAHREAGGEAVFISKHTDGDHLTLARGSEAWDLMPINAIAATMNGLIDSNVFNARFAVATAWALGIEARAIREALSGFSHSAHDNPGRYNFIDGFPFTVLCDYAQNPDGVGQVLKIVDRLEVVGRRHLVCMTIGARHRQHIDELAQAFSDRFETICLGGNQLNIERNPEWAGDAPRRRMLDYFRQQLLAAGMAPQEVSTFEDEAEAVRAGLAQARPGDLLLVLAPPEIGLPELQAARNHSKGQNA